MKQSCSFCNHPEKSLIPDSWCEADGDEIFAALCYTCFAKEKGSAVILLSFETPRGGLLSRWTAEGFAPRHLVVEKDRLYTLAHLLDAHHLALILAASATAVPAQLLEDYRETGALYHVGVVKFWEEMVGFY